MPAPPRQLRPLILYVLTGHRQRVSNIRDRRWENVRPWASMLDLTLEEFDFGLGQVE